MHTGLTSVSLEFSFSFNAMVKVPVTIVCQYDEKDNIIPVKYRISYKDGTAKTYPIVSIKDINYGKFKGDLSIAYECIADVEDEAVECVIRFNTEIGRWDLFVK